MQALPQAPFIVAGVRQPINAPMQQTYAHGPVAHKGISCLLQNKPIPFKCFLTEKLLQLSILVSLLQLSILQPLRLLRVVRLAATVLAAIERGGWGE